MSNMNVNGGQKIDSSYLKENGSQVKHSEQDEVSIFADMFDVEAQELEEYDAKAHGYEHVATEGGMNSLFKNIMGMLGFNEYNEEDGTFMMEGEGKYASFVKDENGDLGFVVSDSETGKSYLFDNIQQNDKDFTNYKNVNVDSKKSNADLTERESEAKIFINNFLNTKDGADFKTADIKYYSEDEEGNKQLSPDGLYFKETEGQKDTLARIIAEQTFDKNGKLENTDNKLLVNDGENVLKLDISAINDIMRNQVKNVDNIAKDSPAFVKHLADNNFEPAGEDYPGLYVKTNADGIKEYVRVEVDASGNGNILHRVGDKMNTIAFNNGDDLIAAFNQEGRIDEMPGVWGPAGE